MRYLDFLRRVHEIVDPDLYFEIGVRQGRSLSLARRRAVGVDPRVRLEYDLAPATTIVEKTSDEFFESDASRLLASPPQLALIDGMHHSDFALRDFMNLERHCAPGSLIVLDDVLPRDSDQASRQHYVKMWAGDVWKVLYVLREHRPDLTIKAVDTRVTGVAVITDLDPASTVLADRYPQIEAKLVDPHSYRQEFETEVVTRTHAEPGESVLDWLRDRAAVVPGTR